MKNFILIFSFSTLFISCKIEPKEINFGHDECYYCKMTIVDKPFASEVVNSKGKAFMYDAIECMIKNRGEENLDAAMYLVYDYQNSFGFIDATVAYYIISDKINSPMGENLAAFQTTESAEMFIKENGGKLLNWKDINTYFGVNE